LLPCGRFDGYNFSRKIIAYRTSDSVSGLSTTVVLQKGYDSLHCVPVRKINLIAGVDVTYSNSLIEAVNKILKYRYLFRVPIPDLGHLATAVMKAIEDYNNRPHWALWGLTPNQVHAGTAFDKEAYRERIRTAFPLFGARLNLRTFVCGSAEDRLINYRTATG